MLVERWGSSDQLGILQQISADAAKAHAKQNVEAGGFCRPS
jgi:hypothetical protein